MDDVTRCDAGKVPAHRILRTIQIMICQACLDGEGVECHTPGCAMWLHRVDLPFDSLQYEIIDTFVVDDDAGSICHG